MTFYINLTEPRGDPDIQLNTVLGMSVRVFLDDIKFESVVRLKQIALPMWVGHIKSAEGLKRTIKLSKRKFLYLTSFQPKLWSFPAFRPKVTYWLFLGLEPASLQTVPMPSALLGL